MRDHYYKAVACDLLQKLHYLYARLGVERARRLVCQQNVRIVHERTRYRHTLHLTARHLVGLFFKLIAESYALKHRLGTAAPFGAVNAGYRQGKLYV